MDIDVALIGLDTSHAIEFTRRIQGPDCPPDQKVEGMRVRACLRFPTPFTDAKVLAERTATLESWGVRVTDDFDEAVAAGKALIVSINDPAYHLEYFEKCARLGKPMFLDKPIADTYENGKAIARIAERDGARFFSSSSLRYVKELTAACADVPNPDTAAVYGPLGKAPAGSSIVWYGVHAVEMLQRAMGVGAVKVTTVPDRKGVVIHVDYADGRRGIVELTEGSYLYGGTLRTRETAKAFSVDMRFAYVSELRLVSSFFAGGPSPATPEDALEVMRILDAAQKSVDGRGWVAR